MHLNTHLDFDVLAHETDDTVSVLLELSAPEQPVDVSRTPGTLVVVLDRSGSMKGDRLDGAKTALLAVVDRLDPQDRFGLVTFADEVQVVVPAGPLADKQAVKQVIAEVYAGGCTNLSAGYFRGLQEAKRVTDTGATLLLVSDGHANAGVCDLNSLGGVARKAHTDGVTTTTLGFGRGYDERLLSALASGGSGNELFADTADDAVQQIAGEVTGLLSLSAQAGSLLIRMSPYVRAVQIVNELTSVAVPDGVLVELGSFYSGETRKLILTFDVPGIAALGLAEIASLEFRYVALPALEQQTVTVPVHVNVVPGDQAAGRVPDPVVRTELAFQQAQRAKRDASSALSAGDVDAAGTALTTGRRIIEQAVRSAPPALAGELRDELEMLDKLTEESRFGDVSFAAKLGSTDSTLKSRTRGRRRPSA